MEASEKTKDITTLGPSDPTSGCISGQGVAGGGWEVNRNTNSRRYMHPEVHCSIIYHCQDLEAT